MVKGAKVIACTNHQFFIDMNRVLKFVNYYTIYRNGKVVSRKIPYWQTALKIAKREAQQTLFEDKKPKVEILNIWTGEIISVEEAEKRANSYKGAEHCEAT